MPIRDGVEIRATLKSLVMLLNQMVIGNREPTSDYMTWFLIKLNDLLQFAGDTTDTAKKLQQIIESIQLAQQKLQDQGEEIQDEFYSLARKALGFMDEVMNASTSGPLESLTSDILLGRHVVYFDAIITPHISVGRVEKEHQFSLSEMVENGLIADVTLLQADQHEKMITLFYQTYIYGNPRPPAPGLLYAWPTGLPPQTFESPKRPEHYIPIRLKTDVQIIIASSLDFEDHED